MHIVVRTATRSVVTLRLSIFIATLLVGTVLPMLSSPSATKADSSVTCSPNGLATSTTGPVTNGSGSNWLNGGGVNVCNNGSSIYDDYGANCVAVSGAPGDSNCPAGNVYSGEMWQCVEMVNRLYLAKGWITARWKGNGGGSGGLIYNLPANLTDQLNNAISYVNQGDVITLNNSGDPSGYGHAAIINSVSGTTVNIINQNAALNSSATITAGSLANGNATFSINNWPGYQVQAIVHAPADPGLGGGDGSSRATNNLDAWVEQSSPTNGSNLGHVVWTGSTWNPWETIPVSTEQMTTQPAAVSWSSNRIDVFARGPAGDLIHTWTDNPNNLSSWNPWESLGGCIIGSPTVTSYGVGRLDVFAEGCNTTGGNLWHTWYDTSVDPNHWQPWENIATSLVMTAPPSAVSWAPGRIDVFARGTDASLMHTFYDGAWESVLSLGGCMVGSPAAAAWAPQRLDVFVEGCNTTGGNFYHTFWNGQWNSFDVVNSSYQVSGVLGAVSWGSQRIDMFTRRSDNTLDHWWRDVNGWNGPDNRGGSLAS